MRRGHSRAGMHIFQKCRSNSVLQAPDGWHNQVSCWRPANIRHHLQNLVACGTSHPDFVHSWIVVHVNSNYFLPYHLNDPCSAGRSLHWCCSALILSILHHMEAINIYLVHLGQEAPEILVVSLFHLLSTYNSWRTQWIVMKFTWGFLIRDVST